MDKRSIFFAIALFTSFYGIQAWFESENRRAQEKAVEIAKQQAIAKQKEIEYQISSRLTPVTDFPLVNLYAKPDKNEKIATAVKSEGYLFTFTKETRLPQQVFIETDKQFECYELAASSNESNNLVLYHKKGSKPYQAPSIPGDKTVDIQMLTLGENVRSILAEQKGIKLEIPYQQLNEKAICFLQNDNKLIPVGVFNPDEKKIQRFDEISHLSHIVQQDKAQIVTVSSSGEQFYVLENDYQMLVFSTKGGSLAEINLPLRDKDHPNRLVKEIDFDREILKNSPPNATFPLHNYFSFGETGKTFNQTTKVGGYYPLLRRSIIQDNFEMQTSFDPKYYALSVHGEDSELSNINYEVTRFEKNLIQFVGKTKTHKITKTFSIPEEKNGPYCFILDLQIEGDATNLWISSGIPDVEIVGGSYTPLLRFQQTIGKFSDVETIDLPRKEPSIQMESHPNWISNSNGFFGIIVDPLDQKFQGYKAEMIDGKILPTRLTTIDAQYNLYPAEKYPGYQTSLPLDNKFQTQFRVFAGPYDQNLLKTLDGLYDNPLNNYNPEYLSAQKIQGWFSFISEPFSKFLAFLIQTFYEITHSWALAIILLTIALRLMMQPFNARSAKVTQEQNEKKKQYASQIALIKQKFKSDPRKEQIETMKFYKEKGIHLTPISGCLPQLLQMPFLFGMFYLLKSFFPLRGAPFIPGWIDDLSAPDIVFSWGQPLWFIGNEFHLLPILMGASMYFQMKSSTAMQMESSMTDEQKQAMKIQSLILPFVMAILFYDLPSGVSLYFGLSTLLGIAQQKWTASRALKSLK